MNTIRWADLDARGLRTRNHLIDPVVPPEVKSLSFEERMKEIKEMCEKNGIQIPTDGDDSSNNEPILNLFVSMVK
jgi:hydrogenase maturation factor